MDILLQPDALSLVGSMSNFIIYSESDVVFIIKDHDSNRVIVQHTYNPSDTNRVEVNVKDIIQPLLTFDMRDSSVAWQQTSIIKKFDVTVYDVVKEGVASTTKNVSFDVIRAGVDHFADSAENFLTQNFLTWQPNMKAVTYYSPEYLTYYAVVAAVVKCKTYINGQEATIALADLAAGTCWTIPVTYSVIAGLAKDLPEYYDIWVENAQGSRLTYIQRYYAADIKSEDEEWFLFENSLGGVDSFRAYGDNQMTAEHTHNIAEIEDESEEYRVDTNRKHKKSTGFIGKKERLWLLDFFPSLAKYVYAGSALRRITVTESDASYTSSDTPSSYSFTYKLSDTNAYLNLPRTDIPQGAMDIKVPDVGSFTIAPRLVEFPRQTLSGGALFPVQNPYSENWAVTTAAALFTFIVSQLEANYANNGRIGHTHPNIDLLNGLSVLEGYLLSDGNKIKASFADDVAEASATLKKFLRNDKDGEVNGVIDFKQGLKIVGKAIAAIITSKDATAAADTNIYSALKACATFLRKDQEDSTEFLVKLLGGIITDSIKSKDFMQGLLGSGFAMFFDENNKSYLQVDKLVVTAKAIFASLELRKLSFVGGNFIFSASGATLTKVEEISTGWRCYIHTDDGTTATANMWAVGDMAKCQTFNIKPGVYDNVSNRYWWRKVDAVGDNYIDISATDHDTSVANDAPQVGDVLVQQGNKTDPTRQNMIAIMTVGEEAPAIIQYIGINDYDLTSHRRITISPKGNKIIADSYIVEIDGKQETLATVAALKVLSDSITTSVTSIQKDLASKLNSKGTWVPGSYQANNLVTFNNQMFVALIDNSDCPIVPLTDENGDYLVDENNNIIVPTDENGHVTYSSSWKPYSSNEGVEDNIKNLKTDTTATFKIMSDKIDSKVASTTFNELGKVVNEQSSEISQVPDKITESISASIEQDGAIYQAVTSSLTLDGNKVKLFGKEIDISGAVVFADISKDIKDAKDTATQANGDLSDYKTAMTTTINGLQSQIDGEVDSWFMQVDPTTSNAPASDWTTDILKQRHANDTYTNTNTGASWKWVQTAGVWGWTVIADTATQKALANAAKAQDTADGKRRVFTAQPTTDSVYDIGDIWVNATVGTFVNDMLVCTAHKAAGTAFNIANWKLASKYTDDSAAQAAARDLSDYKDAMTTTINGLQSQIDGEVDSWFMQVDPTTSNAPASDWTTDILKQRHANDTYTNTNTGASWKWVQTAGVWGWTVIADTATQKALANAAKAQDTADGKRRVFTAQPTTDSVYDIGDIWVNATVGTFVNDMLVCTAHKAAGTAFNIANWKLASKYTDDTTANEAQKTANEALKYRDTFATGLGFASYEDMQQAAELGKTIINNGYINTELIKVAEVVAKGLIAQQVSAVTLQTLHNTGEAYVNIQKGIIDIYGTVARNIQFGVNDQGMAVLKYFNNDGVNLYDLGPNGMDTKNLQTAQWQEIQYVRVLSMMQAVPAEGLVSSENASVLFRLNTTWNLTKLYIYHAGKINNTIVSDSANGFTTAADAAAANGKIFTDKHAGNLAYDTYTDNNGSHMITDTYIMKEYRVIQGGVSTTYFWRCSLETFNMINGNY